MALVLVGFLALSTNVKAESVGVNSRVNVESNDSRSSVGVLDRAKVENEDGNNDDQENEATGTRATSSREKDDNEDDEDSQGDNHRSRVANIVQDLLSIADREGGIGEEIRLVAQEQASTSIKVKDDMDEVNGESGLKVFLFGSNFKNLGDLRSTIVTTNNHIERLKKAEQRASNSSVRADLTAQITALQNVASTTESFVEQNESKFSLLGWLVRLFSK